MVAKYVDPGYWIIGYAEGDQVDLTTSTTIQIPTLLGFPITRGVYLSYSPTLQNSNISALPVSVNHLLYTATSTQDNNTTINNIEVYRDLTSSTSTQINSTTVGAVSNVPFFLAATTIQINSSSTESVTQDRLLRSNTTNVQLTTSSTVSITQVSTIYTASTQQSSSSLSVPVIQVFDLITEDVSQNNISSTEIVTQDQPVLATTSLQANSSSVNSIAQSQILSAINVSQINLISTNNITIDRLLITASTVQNNTSTTGQIAVTRSLLASSTVQQQNTTANTIATTRTLYSTSTIQNNTSSANSILQDKIFYSSPTIQINNTTVNSITPTELYASDSIQINTSIVFYYQSLIELSKLRILYNDIIYTSTITGNTKTNFNVENIKLDNNRIWRSAAPTTAEIQLTWADTQIFNTLVISNSNLSPSTTIRLVGYTNINDTVAAFDTSKVTIRKGSIYSSVLNMYSYGNSNTTALWIDNKNVRKLIIYLEDTTSTAGFIEISKIMLGTYWSPKYGQEAGISTGISFNSNHTRTQSGNIYTDNGTVNRYLKVPLNWLLSEDRLQLIRALKSNGINKPIFISAFPNSDSINMEELYQVYGKLSNTATLTYPLYEIYTTELTVEEV